MAEPTYTGAFAPENARVAVLGAIYSAPEKTPIPAADIADPASPWRSLGTFSDDGVEHEYSEDSEDVTSWQKGTIRVIVKGKELTLKLSALESSPAVLSEFYGSDITIDAVKKTATLDIKNGSPRKRNAYLFQWNDGDARWRLWIPSGQVSEVESPKFNASGVIEWGMTIKALGSTAPQLAQWQIADQSFVSAPAGIAASEDPPTAKRAAK